VHSIINALNDSLIYVIRDEVFTGDARVVCLNHSLLACLHLQEEFIVMRMIIPQNREFVVEPEWI
jgi:hypothetical protein